MAPSTRKNDVIRSSTQNLHRRYRHLFRLPSTSRAFTLLLASSILVAGLPGVFFAAEPMLITSAILAVCVINLVAVRLEAVILRLNPLGTVRRLAIVSSITNFVWLILLLIGALVTSFASLMQFASLLVLGMFFAASLKLIIMRSAFLERVTTAIPLALLHPVLTLAIVTGLNPGLSGKILSWIPFASGIILVVLVVAYLELVNRSGFVVLRVGSLRLLRAFLTAWAEDNPELLEETMSDLSSEVTVAVDLFSFQGNGRELVMVVPEAHPGPFSPIGSSNLPYQLHSWFKDRGYSPMILHSISGHELNLPSKAEVEKLLSSLKELQTLGFSKTCSLPVQASLGRAHVTGVAYGRSALITVALKPGGMEDFPRWTKSELEAIGTEAGFEHMVVVDCHNCEDETPSEDDCRNVLQVARTVCGNLSTATQYSFKVGYAHSSEFNMGFERDVGPAGFAVILFEAEESCFGFVDVDSNNAKEGVRELIVSSSKSDLALQFCTSDTHITAGKTIAEKGYIALGELTSPSKIVEVVDLLVERARERLHPATVEVKKVKVNVKVVGGELLDQFSAFLDRVSRFARNLSYILIATALMAIIVSALA